MAARVSAVAVEANDDVVTIVGISLVAEMLGDVVHEGLGHAAVALLTGAKSGVLSLAFICVLGRGIRLHL